MANPLLDRDFLKELDQIQEKEIYAKIISLTLDEEPLQEITGSATGGSISIDGSSAVRRTCNLTMVTDQVNVNSFYWGLHTKFKLSVGLKNKINNKYPDIIWFPMGIYAITAFNVSQSVNNYTISISGKDKMCYLNGELGGTVTALTHDFGTYDYTDEYGVTTNQSNPIRDIIIEAVHEFGHEPFQNIQINDLDDYGIELLEYRGEDPMYFLIDSITGEVANVLLRPPKDGDFIIAGTEDNYSSNGKRRLSIFRAIEDNTYSEKIDNIDKISATLENFTSDNTSTALEDLILKEMDKEGASQEIKDGWVSSGSASLTNKMLVDIKVKNLQSSLKSQEQSVNDFQQALDMNMADLTSVLNSYEKFSSTDKNFSKVENKKLVGEIHDKIENLTTNYSENIISVEELVTGVQKIASSKTQILDDLNNSYLANLDIKKDVLNSSECQALIEKTVKDYISLRTQGKTLNDPQSIYSQIVDFGEGFIFNPLFDLDVGADTAATNPTLISDGTNYYSVAKIEYGQTAGYRLTDLTYAGDLIMNTGETITAMLDKIVSMLGNFEYFYDLNGHFVFQKKRTYATTSWNNIVNNNEEQYVDNAAYTSAVQYSFEDSKLITSFSNNPTLSNLKNDFSIWGTRKGITGSEIPVHMRYALDTKPNIYKAFDGTIYTTMDEVQYIDYVKKNTFSSGCFQKTPNPNGIPEDWWELRNWAEYYKIWQGHYPTEVIYKYTQTSNMNPSQYFSLHPKAPYGWPSNVVDDWIIKDGMYYHTHSQCNHTLTWWLAEFAKDPSITVYIYKPITATGNNNISGEITGVIVDTSHLRPNLDWRELIYQMALDYRKYNRDSDFNIKLYNNNGSYVKNGLTGYESYYTDLEGFWRQIYNPDYVGTFETASITSTTWNNSYFYLRPKFKQCKSTDIFHSGIQYYTRQRLTNAKGSESKENWYLRSQEDFDVLGTDTIIYSMTGNKLPYSTKFEAGATYLTDVYNYTEINLSKDTYYKDPTQYYYGTEDYDYCYGRWHGQTAYNSNLTYFTKTRDEFDDLSHWKNGLLEYPENLNFWFDFLDSSASELGKYNVKTVGSRPKSANDNNVKAIYFRETPTVIFMQPENAVTENQAKSGYTYIQLGANMENLFSVSSQGKSAKDVIDEWLYQYTYCTESIQIQAIPVYYLEPNTRIYIKDDSTKIDGEYIASKISLPLTAKGTMSISAIKAVDRIY